MQILATVRSFWDGVEDFAGPMLLAMRSGYSLIETLLSLVVLTLLLCIGLPRFGVVSDQLAVNEQAGRIAAAHRRARVTAILLSRPIVLTVAADSLVLADPDSGVQWSQPGPAAAGVALAGPARTLTFSPIGISIGVSNASFQLVRGNAVRTVIVSRLGRLRIR